MARYQAILAYDGTGFAGSQRQANKRTVQGEFEAALRRLGWSGRSILLAGRTDTGVHASGQVAAFDLEWRHSPQALAKALNATLPVDLVVCDLSVAREDFHPRFDALSRTYRYRLFCAEVRDPLRERYAWRVWPRLDGKILPELALLWIGKHDFAAFGSPTRPASGTVRTVLEACWQEEGETWVFEVQANAFLYRMVRRLVYVQVAAAQGRLSAETIARALQEPASASSRTEALPAGLAPACGLTLVRVTYPVEDCNL
jgi:tRNA pseudouridine38-40 synthase